MLLSTVGSALEVFLIWGFSHALWAVALFVLLYGATAGGFAVLRPRFTTAIVGGDDDKEQSLLVFGVLTAARGVVIVLSGFIAEAQLDARSEVTGDYGAGKWLKIIVYTGAMMLGASLGNLGVFLPKKKGKETEVKEG